VPAPSFARVPARSGKRANARNRGPKRLCLCGQRNRKREYCMAWPMIAPVLLLCISNVFMTFAWYGQLKFPAAPLWILIPVSWGIAFFEYCFAVPANHIGHTVYSAAQLKTMQEVITLAVFAVFSVTYLGEALKWNHGVAFVLLIGAAYFAAK
jgi:uncharacterized protein (DUF486 family)